MKPRPPEDDGDQSTAKADVLLSNCALRAEFSLLASPIAQIPARKFPAPWSREFHRNRLTWREFFCCVSRPIPCKLQKIPCRFPHIREFGCGDQFVADCTLHHAVRCEPMFSGLRQIGRNLRAFPRVQMRDVRSLPPAEVAIASILAAGLWALQTRSWRRTELHVKNRDDRPGSNRQTEHRVLAGPLGRSIAQASDADAAR
jgi:hypothetical protein